MTQDRFTRNLEFAPPWDPNAKYGFSVGSLETSSGASISIDGGSGVSVNLFLRGSDVWDLLLALRGLHQQITEAEALKGLNKQVDVAVTVDENVEAAAAEGIPF